MLISVAPRFGASWVSFSLVPRVARERDIDRRVLVAQAPLELEPSVGLERAQPVASSVPVGIPRRVPSPEVEPAFGLGNKSLLREPPLELRSTGQGFEDPRRRRGNVDRDVDWRIHSALLSGRG
jgi:hypothetical protein